MHSMPQLILLDFYFVFAWMSYVFQRPSDSEKLLQRSLHDAEEGLELQDEYGTPPSWIDKLEEAQYTISK